MAKKETKKGKPEAIDPAEVEAAIAEENALIDKATIQHLQERVVRLNLARKRLTIQVRTLQAKVEELMPKEDANPEAEDEGEDEVAGG